MTQTASIEISAEQRAALLREAQKAIRLEADTLVALAQSLAQSEDFVRCVGLIARSGGRVAVTGIGKSAIVAQKIAATLNSTGQPALFLHAADAIHGDLGMIQANDVVLCLSKSGETPEIRVLAPLVKNFGNPLVAMTANPNSALALASDLLLYTPVAREADPNNLAPTSSTTAQMALGDALAIGLLTLRGFKPEDFARYHPGGALGKKLYLRVGDLCARHEAPAVSSDSPISAVIVEISSRRLGCTGVVNADGHLCGIITDGDLRRMLERNARFDALKAADIMTPNPKTISADALAADALAVMRAASITQLLALDAQGRYVGVAHLHDLVREGIL